ncbi:unnamed protein product [Dicrocoelium dendriticum]|nr:unnamed protein product [Dicrocoelium dendriticum]
MTVGFDDSVCTDDKILSIANYALKLIGKPPELTDVYDISVSFILHLSVELFGLDLLPYPDGISYSDNCKNVAAVVNRLASEIGVDLDHILPQHVARGQRRATSDLLELLTAYIAYCVDDSFLVPDSGTPEIRLPLRDDEAICTEQLTGFHLSTSPELPRCTDGFCPPAARLQNDIRPVLLTDGIGHTVPHHDTNAVDHSAVYTDKPRQESLDMWPTFALSHDKKALPYASRATSDNDHPHLINYRHPSFLATRLDGSPPTTPKTVDDMMEIINHSPPRQSPVSLKSSPKYALSTGATACPDIISDGDHHLIEVDASADKVSSLNNRRFGRSRKASSSSSGRGHSPTQTLTAPGASATSAAPSLSESLADAPERFSPISATPGIRTNSDATPHRRKHKQLHKLTYRSRNISHDSRGSATTDSNLDEAPNNSTTSVKEVLDDLVSLLASSFHSHNRSAKDGNVSFIRSSASKLFARSKTYTKALQRRLDYLRSIFSRAHAEAVAVSTLVQALGLKNTKTLNSTHRRIHYSEMGETTSLKCGTFLAGVELMLQQILDKLNLLVQRIDDSSSTTHFRRPDLPHRISIARRHQRLMLDQVFANHTDLSSPVTVSADIPVRNLASDFEFIELLNMKHSRSCLSVIIVLAPRVMLFFLEVCSRSFLLTC